MIKASPSSSPVFISYAWGDSADQKKTWIHQKIVRPLEGNGLQVFWDHESVLPGRSFAQEISTVLRNGSADILCICDSDFIKAASKRNSGVYRELEILSREADRREIRIIPLLVDSMANPTLPAPLTDRRCINLTTLIQSDIPVGSTLKLALDNATAMVLEKDIADRVRRKDIHDRASLYFGTKSWAVHGNPATRLVSIGNSKTLLPAKWMYNDVRFKNRVTAKRHNFDPGSGVWYWNYETAVMMFLTLGVAVSSEFFPHKIDENTEDIVVVGYAIARNIICTVSDFQPLTFDWKECVEVLLLDDRTTNALDRLIS
jgi:hypothetical protein